MKIGKVKLSSKEYKFIRNVLFKNTSDENFMDLSDEVIIHRILSSAMGENNKTEWTQEELYLLKSDKSIAEIHRLTGRSKNSIYNKRARYLHGKQW